MLLYSDIIYFFVQMILHFQKKKQLCTFLKLKKKLKSFHLDKMLIKYEFLKFMFL